MNFSRLSLTAVLVLAALPAPAQDLAAAAAFIEKRFKQLDADGDGKLSALEAKPAEVWLKGADADKDGFFTPDEVRTHLRSQIGAVLEARRGIQPADATKVADQAPPVLEAAASPREEPARLKPAAFGIGTLVPDATLTDLDGAPQFAPQADRRQDRGDRVGEHELPGEQALHASPRAAGK